MMHTTVHPGHVLPLYRRVEACPDPLALFASLCSEGRAPDTLLLESADAATGINERSILIPRAAVRIACLGRAVHVHALTPNGTGLVLWLADALDARGFHVERRGSGAATASVPPSSGPPTGERSPTSTEELPTVRSSRPDTSTLVIGPRRSHPTETLEPVAGPAAEQARTQPTEKLEPVGGPADDEETPAPPSLPHLIIMPPPAPDAPRDEATRLREPSVLDVLRQLVTQVRCISAPSPMAHFAAGLLDYDLIDAFEELPPAADATREDRRFVFWIPEACILVDHLAGATTVLASVFGGPAAETAYHDATRHIEALTRAVQAAPAATQAKGPPRVAEPPSAVDVDIDDETFAARVGALKERIVAGDVFQIVPSRAFSTPCPDPLAAYGVLRHTNPSPYMFFVRQREEVLFGASPETCVRVRQPERRIEICPIAGTARRGRRADGTLDHDLDTRLEAELRADTKELAEHMMLVDLARNDVARVCKPGTRRVSRLLTVERYSHVMHLVSVVDGELAPDLDALHAYAASMNMGTLVGAPKLRAAALLREHEATRRGPYGGAVGFLTFRGEMNTAIVIRSAVVRDGVATVRAGAGVVHDSIPHKEAEETRRKAASVLAAIATAHEDATGEA